MAGERPGTFTNLRATAAPAALHGARSAI